MIKSAILVFFLCCASLWGTNVWPQETIGELYTNSDSTLSWWTRITNRYGWLGRKLGSRYTFERSVGVVIAIGDYKDTSDFDDLGSPAGDAMRMKDFLINEADFDQVHVLLNDDASGSNIRALMESVIPRIVGPNDRLLVYWSGHGGSATDSSKRPYGFLALQDATKDGRIDSIHMDDTHRWLRRIQARHVLFVFDACYSGLTLQTASAPPNDPEWEQIAAASEFLLTSSASDQESYGHSDGSGGLFTTAFLEGARGKADTNRDGLATISEIALYTERRLREGHLFAQTSQFGSIGRQQGRFFFPSGIEPDPLTLSESRPVEPTADKCTAATADYQSFVKTTQQCGTVAAFLERYAQYDECFAFELASQRKNELCLNQRATQDNLDQLAAEQTWIDEVKTEFIAPDMIQIPAGMFMMGSDDSNYDDEKPVRRVTVPTFELARNELTWGEWQLCEAARGCTMIRRPDYLTSPSHPVVNVDIASVNEYLAWINKQTSLVYRLPSESEWEYGARAGSTTKYSWGDIIGKNQANCDRCGSQWDNQSTAPVASFDANTFGLYDMHGNVWEWVADDCWHNNYKGAPTDESAWVNNCTDTTARPIRGGAWDSVAGLLRSAVRDSDRPSDARPNVGFRLARTLP